MNERDRVYRRAGDVVERTIAGEHVLVPIKQKLGDLQNIFALNDAAAYIFEQLDGCRSAAQLCESLAQRCGVIPEQVESDVLNYLEELVELELVCAVTRQVTPA